MSSTESSQLLLYLTTQYLKHIIHINKNLTQVPSWYQDRVIPLCVVLKSSQHTMWGPATEKALGISTDMLGEAAAKTELVGEVFGKYWPEIQEYVSVELEGIILETEAVKLLSQRKNGLSVQCACCADSHGLVSCR